MPASLALLLCLASAHAAAPAQRLPARQVSLRVEPQNAGPMSARASAGAAAETRRAAAEVTELASLAALPPMDSWTSHVGEAWGEFFFDQGLKPDATVVEIAPGSAEKIGLGLKHAGFKGTLYIVEPDRQALDALLPKYRALLPQAQLVPLALTLDQAVDRLPKRPDAIVANHPLDDMIAGKPLSRSQFSRFFDDHYDGADIGATKRLWNLLHSRPGTLAASMQAVQRDWMRLFEATQPKLAVIAQYPSRFFREHGLLEPDRRAQEVLERMRETYLSSAMPRASDRLAARTGDPAASWLALDRPGRR